MYIDRSNQITEHEQQRTRQTLLKRNHEKIRPCRGRRHYNGLCLVRLWALECPLRAMWLWRVSGPSLGSLGHIPFGLIWVVKLSESARQHIVDIADEEHVRQQQGNARKHIRSGTGGGETFEHMHSSAAKASKQLKLLKNQRRRRYAR